MNRNMVSATGLFALLLLLGLAGSVNATESCSPRDGFGRTLSSVNAGDALLVVNFANADMVGHTANRPRAIADCAVFAM